MPSDLPRAPPAQRLTTTLVPVRATLPPAGSILPRALILPSSNSPGLLITSSHTAQAKRGTTSCCEQFHGDRATPTRPYTVCAGFQATASEWSPMEQAPFPV